MIKQFILLLNFIGLFLVHWYTGNVTIDETVPASAKAGSEFTVEVTINKGATGGFARFQDELPEGFTATAIDTKGGDPRFDSQKFKVIWTSLPGDKEIKISYKVVVANTVPTGDFTINSKFSFIADNNKQEVTGSHAIHIEGNATVVATNPPDNGVKPPDNNVTPPDNGVKPPDNNVVTPPDNGVKPPDNGSETSPVNVVINRIVPTDPVENQFNVEIHLKKGSITGFAKVEDELPAGCTAEAITTANSDFKFEKQKVKFIWVSIPAGDAEIVVSYKVTIDPSVVKDNIKLSNGKFAYILNDAPKTNEMAANTVLVKGASGTLADTGVKPPDNTAVTPPDNGVKPPDNNVVTPPDNGVKPPDHTEPVNPVADNGTKIPAPQGNVMFKVQIMALHKDIPNSYFSQAYGINEPIEKEMHEGYQKYILSKSASPNYKDAHDYRDNVRPKVKDAWVTAYINGQRRTCQEALMVSGQKWLR